MLTNTLRHRVVTIAAGLALSTAVLIGMELPGTAASAAEENTPSTLRREKPRTTRDTELRLPASDRREGSKGSSSIDTSIFFAVVGAAAGATAAALLTSHRRGRLAPTDPQRPSPAPTAEGSAAVGAHLAELTEARNVLACELIAIRDRVTSDALRDEIRATLEQVGVHEIVVEPGTPFDPQHHLGSDSVTIDDAAWDQRVATTEHPGYYCGDCVLRPPSVVVYRFAR